MGFTVNEWMLAAGAGVAAMWRTLRAWLDLLVSIVWVRSVVEHPASVVLLDYVHRHYRVGALGSGRYDARAEYVRPLRRTQLIAVEKPPVHRLYWNGLAMLSIAALTDAGDMPMASVRVGHVRGFFDLPSILTRAHAEYGERHSGASSGRYRITRHMGHRRVRGGHDAVQPSPYPSTRIDQALERWRPLGWKESELGADAPPDPFTGLVLQPSVERAAETIRRWRASEGFCRSRRIPWRMGVLLHGSPGTGKTSFARAIAQELDLPVHSLLLASMDNEDLQQAWTEIVSDTPCVALLEDLDRTFDGDANRHQGSHLTLDALLNCISGVEPAEGVLTIVTVNDAGRLDRALGVPEGNGSSSRPGRLDMAVEFGEMTVKTRLKLAELILGDEDSPELAEITTDFTLKTPAQVQARCAELALARLYEGG